jgi:hypothetical protein
MTYCTLRTLRVTDCEHSNQSDFPQMTYFTFGVTDWEKFEAAFMAEEAKKKREATLAEAKVKLAPMCWQ